MRRNSSAIERNKLAGFQDYRCEPSITRDKLQRKDHRRGDERTGFMDSVLLSALTYE